MAAAGAAGGEHDDAAAVPPGTGARGQPGLVAGDWAVLGLLGEGATHGFAVATALGPGGSLGRIWTLPRPIVYQSLGRLRRLGFLAPQGTERTQFGPVRTILAVTPAGRQALDSWLAAPVAHLRDVRSLLLLKLALRHRAGLPLRPLVDAQRRALGPGLAGLKAAGEQADGFERIVTRWRIASYEATWAFLDELLTLEPAPPARGTGGRGRVSPGPGGAHAERQ